MQERQDRQQLEMQERQDRQDKHWGNMHKQLGKQFSDSQEVMGNKLTEALKISGKAKMKRIQPTFLPKRDIDDYTLYRAFKRDFQHFIQDVDENNWEDKARWIVECVKGDAHHLIKEITLDQEGYTKALQVLDSKC